MSVFLGDGRLQASRMPDGKAWNAGVIGDMLLISPNGIAHFPGCHY